MKINGQAYRTIWLARGRLAVEVIDQTRAAARFETRRLTSADEAADAIRTMVVRGAPLIGATAAYGVALALRADASDAALERAVRAARRDAADRGQSALGAERMRGACCDPLAPASGSRRPMREAGAHLPTRMSPTCRRHRRARPAR